MTMFLKILWIIYVIFKKKEDFGMRDYEINKETLAVIPISPKRTKIVEKKDEFIIYSPSMKIIDDSCKFFGSSYEGRFNGTKTLTGITHKSPIIIEESRRIIFFPTKSPRLTTCAWLSLNSIAEYEGNNEECTIKFSCGKKLKLPISYNIVDNQVLRATRLESVLLKRVEEY